MDEELSQPRGAQAFVVSHLDSCPFRTIVVFRIKKIKKLEHYLIHSYI